MIKIRPIHPGEILADFFLPDTTLEQLVDSSGIPYRTLRNIMDGTGDVTEVVAERLALVTGTTREFWLNLQRSYDTAVFNKPRPK